MKKIFVVACLFVFSVSVQAETNIEAVKYMNQSQGFSGFNRSLPKTENSENFEQPTKVKKSGEKQQSAAVMRAAGRRIVAPRALRLWPVCGDLSERKLWTILMNSANSVFPNQR